MKRILLITATLVFSNFIFGQTTSSNPELSTLKKFDFGLQGIGFTFEPRLSKKLTVDLSVGAGGGYDIAEGFINYKLELQHPALYFSVTPKYFYNRNTRNLEGKNSILNSGNYVGVKLKYVTPNIRQRNATRNSILTNVHWGIQRAIASNWTFNSHIGVGYAQDIDYNFGTIYPSLDFKISYIIAKP